ncbi:MAG: DUF362 domain-containing protein [Candidatus Zixiibacteriota bacterium]|nr:MAG: DUF362 domain-containing protein [candidate division Zixibacteria bacterium]
MKANHRRVLNKENLGWLAGFLAILWLLVRSGLNPKRLNYPCQRAALQISAGWISAILALFAGSIVLKRILKFSSAAFVTFGAVWFTLTLFEPSLSNQKNDITLPVWESDSPTSTIFVLDSIPPTPGSLAAGDASVPDEHLSDFALDTLINMMEEKGIYLHKTAGNPDGIVAADDIVIIKGNFQWTSYNTTNTDRIKGLIWRILLHPDGFTGEIVVCDNTHIYGTGINADDNNSDDPAQCIIDVVNTFYAKGYPVYLKDWNDFYNTVAWEYSVGDPYDGFVYEIDTKVTYPKFQTPSGQYYISLKYGIWNQEASSYDDSRLCIIDFPVLKAHFNAGATIAVKNWVGVLTTAYSLGRYGGIDPMHDDFLFGPYALVARVMAVTFPRLSIIDATWTTTEGPISLSWVVNTGILLASTDPVASSWYAAKYILTPIANFPHETDPENESVEFYGYNLRYWTEFLVDSAGYDLTRDSAQISVFNREIVAPDYFCGDANGDGDVNLLDILYLIDHLYGDPPGPVPYPVESGDANGDGDINLLDILYLIDYLYGDPSGPDPLCP